MHFMPDLSYRLLTILRTYWDCCQQKSLVSLFTVTVLYVAFSFYQIRNIPQGNRYRVDNM